MGFRVWGLGFGVWGLDHSIEFSDLGPEVRAFQFRLRTRDLSLEGLASRQEFICWCFVFERLDLSGAHPGARSL